VTSYSIPGIAINYTTIGSGTQTGSWAAFGPIPKIVAPKFAVPVGLRAAINDLRDTGGNFNITCTLQLGNAAGTVRASIVAGYLGRSNSAWGDLWGYAYQKAPFACADAITQYRTIVAVYSYSYLSATVSGSISAGAIRVYGGSTADADSDGADPLPLAAVVSAGAAGRTLTKLRWKFDQTDPDAGDWEGAPIGEAVLRRFS
jgi:hypothetical protein